MKNIELIKQVLAVLFAYEVCAFDCKKKRASRGIVHRVGKHVMVQLSFRFEAPQQLLMPQSSILSASCVTACPQAQPKFLIEDSQLSPLH